MGAGKPNFQRLYEMGKLPENQYHQIPGLLEKLEREKQKENNEFSPKCALCDYVAGGSEAQQKSRMKLHIKSHNKTTT